MKVGVLRGGPSSEYDVSLSTGGQILANLSDEHEGHDILIDKQKVWHFKGLPVSPARAARQVDVFFNALHGEYGEDGKVQSILDQIGVPYTGSGSAASAFGMDKPKARELFRQAGLRVPPGLTLDTQAASAAELAQLVFSKISPPWVVKPASGGSSVGLYLARTLPELASMIEVAAEHSTNLLIERHIRGREVTCGVVDNFRGQEVYALPPIEIRHPENRAVWTYEDKYNGATEELCPAPLGDKLNREIERLALAAHEALGLRHYSRSDFIIPASPADGSSQGIYILEVNSLPGLTKESLLPKSLAAIGCNYSNFLDHVIRLATERR